MRSNIRGKKVRSKMATQINKDQYVCCTVEPGMFNGEFLVFVDGVNPDNTSVPLRAQLLADAKVVKYTGTPRRGCPVQGRLAVGVVRTKGGIATVVLPQRAIPVGEAMLVKEETLSD